MLICISLTQISPMSQIILVYLSSLITSLGWLWLQISTSVYTDVHDPKLFHYKFIISLSFFNSIYHTKGDTGKMYSFAVSHVFNSKNKFRSCYWINKFIFNHLFHLEINFKFLLKHWKSYKFPVSWLFN